MTLISIAGDHPGEEEEFLDEWGLVSGTLGGVLRSFSHWCPPHRHQAVHLSSDNMVHLMHLSTWFILCTYQHGSSYAPINMVHLMHLSTWLILCTYQHCSSYAPINMAHLMHLSTWLILCTYQHGSSYAPINMAHLMPLSKDLYQGYVICQIGSQVGVHTIMDVFRVWI